MAPPLITDVRITPIAFPDPPLLNAAGVHQPWALRSVVEVRTDDGRTGLGETYGDSDHLALLHQAASALTGLDVFDLPGLWRRVRGTTAGADVSDRHGLTGPSSSGKTVARVGAAFETALLDLQGQATELPVHALLGGKARDKVPFSAYLFYKWAGHQGAEPDKWGEALDPDGIVEQARRLIADYGFESIKLKGGVFDPAEEIAAVRALSAAFPDHPLRIDPNCAWTVETSIHVAQQTAGLLEYLEDPTPDISGMSELAVTTSAMDIPLATNMCVVRFADLPEAFARNAVQVVLADHHYWGGLRESLHLARMCSTWGVGVSMHSNSHLGISLAAMTHLAAAAPELTYAVDTHSPWQDGVDVVSAPLRIVDGAIAVPDSPGLGVQLDEDALARMHKDYLECGIRDRDDTTYMQRFQPDFTNRRPRW